MDYEPEIRHFVRQALAFRLNTSRQFLLKKGKMDKKIENEINLNFYSCT